MSPNKKAVAFTIIMMVMTFSLMISVQNVYAYGACDEYGFMAQEDYLSGGCTCMSGYVMGKDFMGKTQCVSGSTVCHDKYGYNSSYDSLSKSCECDSGYAFGGTYTTQCVSKDSLCSDQLGFGARYNSLYGKCECGYGDVIEGGRCTDGDQVCHSDHGYNSSYSDYDNKCKCNDGYTFNDANQCVEKQNNVYFKLLDLDTDEKKAIIKSDYDSRKYQITYNSGCYSFSFRRYLNQNIVVNLGTDFELDTWDKIVLQDDNETCDITRRERTFDDAFAVEEEEDLGTYYLPSAPTYTAPTQVTPPPQVAAPLIPVDENFEVALGNVENISDTGTLISAAAFRKCPSTQCTIIRYYAEGANVGITGRYKKGDWYQINAKGDDGSHSIGWIHTSLVNINNPKAEEPQLVENVLATPRITSDTPASSSEGTRVESVVIRIWHKILNWF